MRQKSQLVPGSNDLSETHEIIARHFCENGETARSVILVVILTIKTGFMQHSTEQNSTV